MMLCAGAGMHVSSKQTEAPSGSGPGFRLRHTDAAVYDGKRSSYIILALRDGFGPRPIFYRKPVRQPVRQPARQPARTPILSLRFAPIADSQG